jgi:hypothetical protein
MQEAHSNNHQNDVDAVIDLRELFRILLQGKWTIVSVTALISIFGLIYSLLLPNIYESRALLAPVNPSNGISRSIRGYSGLAGIAGINLPTIGEKGNSVKAMHKIGSLSFFENNILTNIYLPDLMAVKDWNRKKNILSYDESIYNAESDTWIGDRSPQKPSAQKSFEVFSAHSSLSQDQITGFVSLSIKHQSPFIAKQWAELIVNEINNFYRLKDKSESEKAVSYLNKQISSTGLSEIKEVLAQLLQEETKKLSLIEANKFYVFEYIDPPAVMEYKSQPKRALICILSAFMGGMLSVLIVLFRHFAYTKKPS